MRRINSLFDMVLILVLSVAGFAVMGYHPGAEDDGVGVEGVDGLGLFEGEALHIVYGGFAGVEGFVDVGGEDVEAQASLGEEVAAAGRGGGED